MLQHLMFLWQRLKPCQTRFSLDSISRWPDRLLDSLVQDNLLVPTDIPATSVTCDACSLNHAGKVIWVDYPNGQRAFIACPEHIRVEVPPERLRQWDVNLKYLAQQTALILRPNLSKECFQRIESGRFTDLDQSEIMELMTGLPPESKLKNQKQTAKELDALRLNSIVAGLSRQPKILIEFLWNRKSATAWSNLPPTAFREGQSAPHHTRYEALKSLRLLCTKNHSVWGISITLSDTDETVQLLKDVFPKGGK